jgi:cysteinyl-tRNA synthetase
MKPNSAIAGKALAFQKFVKDFGALMSLFQESAHDFLIRLDDLLLKKMNLNRKEINLLVVERSNARDLKDFVRSDELRLKLTSMGIAVSDTSQGSFWEVMK